MPGFPECFAAYGADHRDTMARFLGSESLYLRYLDMLPQDDNLRKLGAALADGDLERAFLAAHTLKGVAGNLGLLPLSRAVCAIVEPLRAREARDYGALYQAVLEEFRRADAFRECLRRNYQGE